MTSNTVVVGRKTVVLLVLLVLMAATSVAIEPKQDVETYTASNSAFSDQDSKQVSLLDRVTRPFSLALSSLTSPSSASPGETVEVGGWIDAHWENGDAALPGETFCVIEVYDCADSGCDDPNQDEFIDAVSYQMDQDVFNGQKYACTADYKISLGEEDGTLGAVGYLWRSGFQNDGTDNDGDGTTDETDEALVSDTPETTFEVVSSNGDTTTSGPDVQVAQGPTVRTVSNGFAVDISLTNTGTSMQESHILELQPRPQGAGPLSTVSGSNLVCDSNYPENVHKEFQISGGDTVDITLRSTGNLEQDQRYTLYLMSRNQCYDPETGYERVQPYPRSANLGTFCLGTCETEISNVTPLQAGLAVLLVLVGGAVYAYRS